MDRAIALKSRGYGLLIRPPVRAALIAIPVLAIAAGTLLGAEFPKVAFSIRRPVNDAVEWVATNLFFVTDAVKNGVTFGLINPIQGFLTESPWWLVIALVVGIAFFVEVGAGDHRGPLLPGLIAMESGSTA